MLDFAEVSRRIAQWQHQQDCDACAEDWMSHEDIVAPLVGQLLDPEYHAPNGTVLLTADECIKLGHTILRQSQVLDKVEQHIRDAGEASRRRVARLSRGVVVAALWLSSVVVAVLLVQVVLL
jgi:hypothetical protein